MFGGSLGFALWQIFFSIKFPRLFFAVDVTTHGFFFPDVLSIKGNQFSVCWLENKCSCIQCNHRRPTKVE